MQARPVNFEAKQEFHPNPGDFRVSTTTTTTRVTRRHVVTTSSCFDVDINTWCHASAPSPPRQWRSGAFEHGHRAPARLEAYRVVSIADSRCGGHFGGGFGGRCARLPLLVGRWQMLGNVGTLAKPASPISRRHTCIATCVTACDQQPVTWLLCLCCKPHAT